MEIMKLERYEEYKDSKVGWLGQVPASWEVRRNKNVFYEASQLSEDGSETLLTVSHITGVTPRSEKNVNMFMAETMQGYKVCKVGDLVINTMWAWMGALGVVRHHGICSPAYGVYRPIKGVPYVPRYFDYLFRTPNFVTEMTRSSKGIVSSRLRLYPKDFYQLQTVVPSLREQQAIVDYLDKRVLAFDKTALILERKITKFLELKKTLINETVCWGLNHNAPSRPSRLGSIPAHWQEMRLKDVAEFRFSNVDKKEKEGETDVLLCNYVDVYKNDFIVASLPFMPSTADEADIKRFSLRKNDLIITKDSESHEDIAVPALVTEDLQNVVCGYHLALIRTKSAKMMPAYLFYLFKSIRFNHGFAVQAKGITRVGLSINALSDAPTLLPPPQEQAEIIAFLDQKTQKIDSIVANLKAQIETLKVLRKTLINEVVTGKLKVTK